MKKYLPLLLIAFLFSCEKKPSPASLEIEQATLKCWNENWGQEKGYDISKGIIQLDNYLFSKGLLGKRSVEDYKKFFNDTAIIFIPDSVKGSRDMNIALNSDFEGAPNIEGMIKCWETNWFKKLSTLDTSDVLHHTGVMVENLAKAGNPDFQVILNGFFTGLTEEELDRPLLKDIAYFVFWKTRGGKTHIQFVHPDTGSEMPPPPTSN